MNRYFQILLIVLLLSYNANGQITRFNHSFFNTNLIVNPSLPGVNKEMNALLRFKTPMSNAVPGLQKDIGFEFNKPFNNGTAGGINILKQSTGILTKQYFLINYGVDLKITENAHLVAGLNFGFRDFQLNYNFISQSYSKYFGNADDPAVLAFVSRPPTFYSGLGLTFYNKNIDAQLVIPNITHYINKQDSSFEDKPVTIGLGYLMPLGSSNILGNNASVKFQFGYLKNLLSYQQENILSVGATLHTGYDLTFDLFYNTDGSINSGFGIDVLDRYSFNFNYLIGGTYSTIIYGGSGQALLGIRYKFSK